MKKATTRMAAAILAQGWARRRNHCAKVQQFFDMCKSFERIESKNEKIHSICMGRRALIMLREYYRGERGEHYIIEHEVLGWISRVNFAADNSRASCLIIEDVSKVTRCIEGARVCASMMEDVANATIAISSIESITYII